MSPDERMWAEVCSGVDRAARIVSVLLVLGIIAVAFSGCIASNATQFMEAAAKYREAQGNDKRSWCVKNDLSTIYGTDRLRLAVTGQENVSVSCTDEGLNVKSDASGSGPITVPISVQPQFRLEQPMVAPSHPSRVPGPPK